MSLKKRKNFTSKKGDSFLMNLFLSPCFFLNFTDLVLVKFWFSLFSRQKLCIFVFVVSLQLVKIAILVFV